LKKRVKRLMRSALRRIQSPRQSYRSLGDERRAAGDWAMAARHYSAHLQANAGDFDIWVQLGHALKESGQLAEADRAYLAAEQLKADSADLALSRGHLAKMRGENATATAFYRQSLSIDGNLAAARELGVAARERAAQAAAAKSPSGAVENIDGGLITGWAIDPSDPYREAEVDILIDGTVVMTVTAEQEREDLPGTGDGGRLRGFIVDLSTSLDLSIPTEVHLRTRVGKSTLEGSPVLLGGSEAFAAWKARWDGAENLKQAVTHTIESMARDVLVSIIVVAREAQAGADEGATIVGEQIDKNWEVLICQDQSVEPDKTAADRTRCVSRGALVEAIGKARGDHIVIIDQRSSFEPEWIWRVRDAAAQGAELIFWDGVELSEETGEIRFVRTWPTVPATDGTARPWTLAAAKSLALEILASWEPSRYVAFDTFFEACRDRAQVIAHIPCVLESHRPGAGMSAACADVAEAEPASASEASERTLVIVLAEGSLSALQATVHSLMDAGAHDTHGIGVVISEGNGPLSRFSRTLSPIVRSIHLTASGSRSLAVNKAVSDWGDGYTNIALIESGLRPTGDWLKRASKSLSHPNVGITAPILEDASGAIASAGLFVFSDRLIHSHQGRRKGPHSSLPDQWMPPSTGSREQSAAYGCVVLRRSTFMDAGGLDLTVEDDTAIADLSLRLRTTGRSTMITEDVVVSTVPLQPFIRIGPVFKSRWAALVGGGDPNHHPGLDEFHRLRTLHTMFCPARLITQAHPPEPASHARFRPLRTAKLERCA
jgi:hypothetical protein